MNTTDQVVAADGRPIIAGTIVGMKDKMGPWSSFEGYVVAPFSDKEDDGYTVAVFFGKEVSADRFNFSRSEVTDWETQYEKNLTTGDWSFLLQDAIWQQCPRVRFFRPEELIVQDNWSIKTLAERIFRNRYHILFGWPKGVSSTSSAYRCFRQGCPSIATRATLWNVWGSVYPMHVCDECFSNTYGWCGDGLPETKNPFLLANGEPVTIPS
ncbi:MAG: hypothetical protein WC027_01820 [Candidatus Paceibacterota bacterium]